MIIFHMTNSAEDSVNSRIMVDFNHWTRIGHFSCRVPPNGTRFYQKSFTPVVDFKKASGKRFNIKIYFEILTEFVLQNVLLDYQ